MRSSLVPILAGTVGIAALLLPGSACAAVSTESLLAEMTDLGALARFPDPPFTSRQASSYDPASKSADEAESWFANRDVDNYVRAEERAGRTEYVLLDVDGPGAIVRIWSANPKGTLRIYFDESAAPGFEAKMEDLLGGKHPGIPAPIAGVRSRGWNCYFPFAYSRHCKVTCDERGFYYHVNYRTYPEGTAVKTFSAADLDSDMIAKVREALTLPVNSTAAPGSAAGSYRVDQRPVQRLTADDALQPGASLVWSAPDAGPTQISLFQAVVRAEEMAEALRTLHLTMEFDGEKAVSSPLGDFFGAAPGLNPYRSLPMEVLESGVMISRWVMPFRDSATIRITNRGRRAVDVELGAVLEPTVWNETAMHFHADWRAEWQVPTRPMQDWNYVAIDGQGVFVGASFSIANPVKQWWGEGDEKIYVDGEEFPSTFGTGTEDYYGYAWCCNEPFTHAYHNQPRCDGPHNYGMTSVNRWHFADRIPFTNSFRFDMELWHWHDSAKVDMAVVAYWYGRPGAKSRTPEPQASDLRVPQLPPYTAPRVAGAIEGEEMRVVQADGKPQRQEIGNCSNDTQLWWTEAGPGGRLVLEFAAPAAGRYRVLGRFVKSYDYGIIQLSINGESAGAALDGFAPRITLTDEIPLGEFELQTESNKLTAEVVGTSDEVTAKNYMFGLDYIRIEPVEP